MQLHRKYIEYCIYYELAFASVHAHRYGAKREKGRGGEQNVYLNRLIMHSLHRGQLGDCSAALLALVEVTQHG